MDPLGQGVSKISDLVTFVSKTLPGEEGECEIYRKSKGVQFGFLRDGQKNLSKISSDRIKPECEHFSECLGCSFLHIEYPKEIEIKTDMAIQALRPLNIPKLDHFFACPQRFHYRNRIQLHYDIKKKTLGLINKTLGRTIAIPKCRLPSAPISEKMAKLYQDDLWIQLVTEKGLPPKGHLEILERESSVDLVWNRPYADGGFSQVNSQTNQILIETLQAHIPENLTVLELFSGRGNLSKPLSPLQNLMFDAIAEDFQTEKGFEYTQLDLYQHDSLDMVLKKTRSLGVPKLLLLDPPRKGYSFLPLLVDQLPVETIAYISCNVSTLTRDLRECQKHYKVDSIFGFDMFPGTPHFETLVILKRR